MEVAPFFRTVRKGEDPLTIVQGYPTFHWFFVLSSAISCAIFLFIM